eukprot:3437583-Rhodomonas_salina.1
MNGALPNRARTPPTHHTHPQHRTQRVRSEQLHAKHRQSFTDSITEAALRRHRGLHTSGRTQTKSMLPEWTHRKTGGSEERQPAERARWYAS